MIFAFSEYYNTTRSQGSHISNYSCINVTTIASWTHGILEIGPGNTVPVHSANSTRLSHRYFMKLCQNISLHIRLEHGF